MKYRIIIVIMLLASIVTYAGADDIEYYTCGMHPSVRVSPEEYDKGSVNCPICNMKLIPVYKEEAEESLNYYGCGMEGAEHVFLMKDAEGMTCPICGMDLKKISKAEADSLKGVVSSVKIKGDQLRLAGVKAEPIGKLHLYKELRTVGKVAYDPQLAIAEEEFISAVRSLEKISEGNIPEIKERTANLVESSRRKLKLLGLSAEQIKELEKTKKVHTNLILPEKKMWIYGDIYEYELAWIKVGEKVKVIAAGIPGEEFQGVISSIDPVLNSKTRSIKFRAEVENADLKLKPGMYVDLVIMGMYMGAEGEHEVLAIPKSAVLDTGTRKIVWLEVGDGKYEGRLVVIGPEARALVDGRERKFYPVLKGLVEGELVVTKANFLIDSQSQISGVAASAYGGSIGAEEKKPPVHQH
ncbi:MAG: efflux RND transporter periplasmic adaptor subunit [Candidatus Omnitrophica bacterium]|nr:efflux RND transporter periplasmic adaptor subunit [Candidatus Omnitrophota bacterium]